MKKNLLLTAVAAMALAMTAQAEVTYEVIFVGKTSTGANASLNPGKGEKMTKNADGSYSCTVQSVQTSPTGANGGTGFKIVSDDANEMAEAGKLGVTTPGQWHTQVGAAPDGSGVVFLNEDASPTTLTSFVKELARTGHTPGEIQFGGGVGKAENVTFTYWPEAMMLKVTGTPTEWRDFGITDGASGWASPVAEKTFTHEGNGIYTLAAYDFGETGGVKTFKIRPKTPATPEGVKASTKPIYGFTTEDIPFGGAPEAPETKAEAESLSQTLHAYHTDSEKRREIGDGSVAASITVTLCHSAKANLTGKYAVKFDANTNELTLTKGGDSFVQSIMADGEAGEVEYYNFQGVRVANPENGLYIVKQGGKVSKRIIK